MKKISYHGIFFRRSDLFWLNLRTFFHTHKTLFDSLFLGLYTLEQLTLFILILTLRDYAHIIAGVFALIVIATISFEKICMESRYSLLKDWNAIQSSERENLIKTQVRLLHDNKFLRKTLGEMEEDIK